MKKFIHDVVNLKFLIGLYFFGILIVYTFVLYFLKMDTIKIITVWQVLGLSVCLGFAHLIYFSHFTSIVKVLLNFLICLVSILSCNYLFEWGLIDFVGIPIFISILLLFYTGCFIAFYIYYKNEEQLLNQALARLKNQG